MKFIIGILVAIAAMYISVVHDAPLGTRPLSILDLSFAAVLCTAPLAGLCRLFTRRFPPVRARIIDLAVLFGVSGVFWALELGIKDVPHDRSAVSFWFAETRIAWLMLFAPYVVSVGVFDWFEVRRMSRLRTEPNPATGQRL